MGLTRQWLETKPASTDKIKDFPAEAQARWKDIREAFNSGGHVLDGVNPLAEQGLHAVSASGVASPDIYKSDRTTKILGWTDGGATLLSGYAITGSKNIPEVTVGDGAVGVDTKGYQRAIETLRIFESTPPDTLVGVKPGLYRTANKLQSAFFVGGTLTIGVGPLVKPAVGNHAHYAIVLNSAGSLTARKGADALYAGSPVDPDATPGDTLIATIRIREDSVNFSLVLSGNNAFLIRDGRIHNQPSEPPIQIGGEVSALTGGGAVTVRATQSLTTLGGLVLVVLVLEPGGTTDSIRIDRDGVEILGRGAGGILPLYINFVHVDNPAAGVHSYTFRATSVPASYRFYAIELPTTTLL